MTEDGEMNSRPKEHAYCNNTFSTCGLNRFKGQNMKNQTKRRVSEDDGFWGRIRLKKPAEGGAGATILTIDY